MPNIALAEEAVKYAAEIIPLVEDVSLDTIWLGLRVRGDGANLGATRSSEVMLTATGLDGPGNLMAYLTGSFGDIDRYFDSSDGFDAATGYRDDGDTSSRCPHAPELGLHRTGGVYAGPGSQDSHRTDPETSGDCYGNGHFRGGRRSIFGAGQEATVLKAGHSDLTIDLEAQEFSVLVDHEHGTNEAHQEFFRTGRRRRRSAQ